MIIQSNNNNDDDNNNDGIIYYYEDLEFGTTLKITDRFPEKIGEENGEEIFRIKVTPTFSNGIVKVIGEEGFMLLYRKIKTNREIGEDDMPRGWRRYRNWEQKTIDDY